MNYQDFKLQGLQVATRREPALSRIFFPGGLACRYEVDHRTPSLAELGEAIGFGDPALLGILSYHGQRSRRTHALAPFACAMIGTGGTSASLILWSYWTFGFASSAASITVSIVALFAVVAVVLIARLARLFLYRRLAGTFCIVEIFNVVVNLYHQDVLANPDKRKMLLAHISDLARVTRSLSSHYSEAGETNQDWIRQHFRQMEQYIWERGRWAASPTATTLDDLRQDFYRLAHLYITGQYGDFPWPEQVPGPEPPPSGGYRRLLRGGLTFLVGVILPLALMALLIGQPKLFGETVNSQTVSLVLLAWLLMALDAALNLGVISRVVSLAREIKDLG